MQLQSVGEPMRSEMDHRAFPTAAWPSIPSVSWLPPCREEANYRLPDLKLQIHFVFAFLPLYNFRKTLTTEITFTFFNGTVSYLTKGYIN